MRKKLTVFLLSLCAVLFCGTSALATEVIPMGKTIGVRIYTDGLLVIGSSDVDGENIAEKCGIRVNDKITEINGKSVSCAEEFSEEISENPDGVVLTVSRDNQSFEVNAVPRLSEDNVYRLGLWVRDSTAGIGTVTYYDPESKSFAALGHCVSDVDTGNILSVKSGNILDCDILSVTKSVKGAPGEISGAFKGDKIGDITVNSPIGIYGRMTCSEFEGGESVTVAAKDQVKVGEAYIISDAFGDANNKYSVEIKKITGSADKSLVIEITDERLKDAAGGIVQGMSGSPIIQNNMLVGALTHVFINNPTRGYGALAENMLDEQRKAGL